MRESMQGTGMIERRLKNPNTHFYMIKYNGYYGFFIISQKGTYICQGGRLKYISACVNIQKFSITFNEMTSKYIDILSPYRSVQEQISKHIKSFGGKGTIHGCIIDIDFYNHIMLNPLDGCITYYYSPSFGEIECHTSLLSLLTNHSPELADNYIKQLECSSETTLQVSQYESLTKIDIKNSIYSTSAEINQLQRLFDKKILRDWDEHLMSSQEFWIEDDLQKYKKVEIGMTEDEMLNIMGYNFTKTQLAHQIKYEWYKETEYSTDLISSSSTIRKVSIYIKNGFVKEVRPYRYKHVEKDSLIKR